MNSQVVNVTLRWTFLCSLMSMNFYDYEYRFL